MKDLGLPYFVQDILNVSTTAINKIIVPIIKEKGLNDVIV